MGRTWITLAALGVAGAVVLGSCSSVTETEAASVNDRSITAKALESELLAIRGNDRYRENVEQGLARQGADISVSGEGTGTFDATFVARLLSLSVYYELLEQEVADLGVQVTDADLASIRPMVINAVGGDIVFDEFPAEYQDLLVRRQAVSQKLQGVIGAEFAPGQAREVYERDPSQFTSACVSHIFASIEERGPDGARARIDDLARQLREGADFEVLAREQSDDPAAAAEGGSLGCGGRGRFLEAFEEAVYEIPVGQVSEPVETEVGFHLVLVEERRPLPFEEVQAQVEQVLQRQQLAAFSSFIDEVTCDAEVEVNPRYGNWVGACDDPEAPGEVLPPSGPTTTGPAFPAGGGPAPATPAG